jgi:hypothetical protein
MLNDCCVTSWIAGKTSPSIVHAEPSVTPAQLTRTGLELYECI